MKSSRPDDICLGYRSRWPSPRRSLEAADTCLESFARENRLLGLHATAATNFNSSVLFESVAHTADEQHNLEVDQALAEEQRIFNKTGE